PKPTIPAIRILPGRHFIATPNAPKFVRLLTMHCCLVSIFRFSEVGVPQIRDVICPLSIKSKNFIGPKSPKPPIDIDKSPCRTLSVTADASAKEALFKASPRQESVIVGAKPLGPRYSQQCRINRLTVSEFHRLRGSATVSRPKSV